MSTIDEVRDLASRISNAGRWGDRDQRGTLNFLDAEAVLRGLDAVRTGETVPLWLPADLGSPRTLGQPMRTPPLRTPISHNHAWTGDPEVGQFNDDHVTMGLQSGTHWDALSHVAYSDLLYNGHPASAVTVEQGATRCGIDRVGPVVGRGLLADVARHRGVEALDHGELIDAEELEAVAPEVQRGDVVVVRTGAMARLLAGDRRFYEHGSCGFGLDCAEWLHDNEVAAYAVDSQNPDPFPPRDDSVFVPFHLLVLRDLGMIQGQNWNLEALADASASDGRRTFLLSATPVHFTGASGAPVAPVAVR